MTIRDIRSKLGKLGNKKKAKILQRFFKTGPGEYGEGDIFLGVKVPDLRRLAKEYQDISIKEVKQLLKSQIHAERLLALLILIHKFSKGNDPTRKSIYELYLKNTRFVNNWDLVDFSAEHIVGAFLMERSRRPLYRLARSKYLWERRISIISTFHFIKQYEFSETLKIGEMLISDEEDLIHKAVGWMLREVGKRDLQTEEKFLKKHYKKMPR
ncbi:MAG: DNA alkylation repair protein, partial [Deltaproteobacteria bacterium]|nr:DNA alkylation repair protein [Deltaproteobacteria bacterium]